MTEILWTLEQYPAAIVDGLQVHRAYRILQPRHKAQRVSVL
jgi:hypothetical protein